MRCFLAFLCAFFIQDTFTLAVVTQRENILKKFTTFTTAIIVNFKMFSLGTQEKFRNVNVKITNMKQPKTHVFEYNISEKITLK